MHYDPPSPSSPPLALLPPYDALPSQNQAQQVQLPPPSHVSPPSAAHAGGDGGQGGQQAPQQQGQQPVGDKQALLANEKRRRRRESHNAVERRRRDNINEKISELATLIPERMLDVGGEFFWFSSLLFSCAIYFPLFGMSLFALWVGLSCSLLHPKT